jgi:aerobic-type carbon monoxide dehydrogenase small subunit (CoxS/CutS family)
MIAFNLNGAERRVETDPDRLLLDVLRDDLDLTGTKYGCGEGLCGACTVLLDGRPVQACITTVGAAAGKRILTIEGLASGGKLHPLQQAFLEEDAMQCGLCTSGMIMGAAGLLRDKPNPSEAEIAAGMSGHICRCGTYPRIIRAVRAAAGKGGRA